MKVTLPEELSRFDGDITTLVNTSSILSNSEENLAQIEPITFGFENETNLFVIYEGCFSDSLEGKSLQFDSDGVTLPMVVTDTQPIEFEIFKDYSNDELSGKIFSSDAII